MDLPASLPVPIGTYDADPIHSYIGFEVKHLSIATVRGAFTRFNVTIDCGSDGLHAAGTMHTASIDTGVPDRDDDLRSAHFLDVENFPEITFTSDDVKFQQAHKVVAHGDLTIKGVTRPIELSGDVGEVQEDPWGEQRVGFDVQCVIDRRDFNILGGNSITNSNVVVGTQVKLVITVSAVRRADAH